MLEGRIKRRLKALNFDSYRQYCDFLFGSEAGRAEVVPLIDVVTTNKTDFFREPRHFELLSKEILPEWWSRNESRTPMLIWSAGCSTGEEPYTLGMVLSEFAHQQPGFRFQVIATDISATVLEKAELGVYSEEMANAVPPSFRRTYFLRSRDPHNRRVRVAPALRCRVEFRRLNLMDDSYSLDRRADIIFCRNVMIYFDRRTQQQILRKLSLSLEVGGYLFVGHAESLHDLDLPLEPVAPSLYRRLNGGD